MASRQDEFVIDELILHGGHQNIRYPGGTLNTSITKIPTWNKLPIYYGYSTHFKAFGIKQVIGSQTQFGQPDPDDYEIYEKIWRGTTIGEITAPDAPGAHTDGCPMVCAYMKLTSFSISRGTTVTFKIDEFRLREFPGPALRTGMNPNGSVVLPAHPTYGGSDSGRAEWWIGSDASDPSTIPGAIDSNGYRTNLVNNRTTSPFGYDGKSVAAMGGYSGVGAVLLARLYVFPDDIQHVTDDYMKQEVTVLSNFPETDWWGPNRYVARNITLTASGMTKNSKVIFALFMKVGCRCQQGGSGGGLGYWPVYAVELTSYFPKEGYVWRKFGSKNTSSSNYDPEGVRIDPDKCDNKWHLVRPVYFMNQKGQSTKWTNVEGEE